MNKEIYANDILHRQLGFNFTETVINDFTLVRLLNLSGNEVANAKKMFAVDAYRAIRLDLLDGETPPFLSTTDERDVLSDIEAATFIYNQSNKRNETFNDSKWAGAAGESIMHATAYGSMASEDTAGTTVVRGWVTAVPGMLDRNGIVTFLNMRAADRLVIGAEGSGDYKVNFGASFTHSENGVVAAVIWKNGDRTTMRDRHKGNATEAADLGYSGQVSLLAGDYLDLRFRAVDDGVIKIFRAEMNIQRIS